MGDHYNDPELGAALQEFQQYLSDQLAPLMVADALEVMLNHPPLVGAQEIHRWVAGQYRGQGMNIPVSDFLYHAVRKVHSLGQFRFVPDDELREYVHSISELVLEFCPEPDRPELRKNLALLGENFGSTTASVEFVHRQGGGQTPLASSIARPVAADEQTEVVFRRFTRLLDQITRQAGPDMPPPAPEMQSRLVESAVTISSSAQEMDSYLERVRQAGVDTQPRKLFEILGSSLPGWAAPFSSGEEGTAEPLSGPAAAMHRIVSMADSKLEGSRRFREMVRSAIDQFNEGSLARAVTMLELADRIATERHVSAEEVEAVRRSEHERIDPERLRLQLEARDSHFLLRRVLNFFAAYQIDTLIEELGAEQKRERRRAILALLQAHGRDAREIALSRLELMAAEKPREETQFVARNLLYLLHRIPRPSEAGLGKELDILAGLSSSSYKPLVVKEAVGVLGITPHERSEKILIMRLRELETAAKAPATSRYDVADVRQLMDRIALALARLATPGALEGLVLHGLSSDEDLGDTRSRLAPLSQHDLSAFPSVLDRLIGSIRAELPRKMLGMVMKRRPTQIPKTLAALAATTAPAAHQLLDEVASRYPDTDFGQDAARLLEQQGTAVAEQAPARAPMMTGDLEVLGLPNLLQNLAELSLTGVLSLIDAEDQSISTVWITGGKIARCQSAQLTGKDAIFQIFEQSRPGTFSFVSRSDPQHAGSEPLHVAPLILEALRRHDELNRARLLVPASARLSASGDKPAPHPAETDPHLIRDVWTRAASGEPPARWQAEVPADAFRIWRLLEHWVETGALEIRRA